MEYYSIDELRIASPCTASWSAMSGDSQVRHCDDCKKNVYNISLLTRAEANDLIREKEGNLCVKLYRRFDGTVLTADCPVGLRGLRRRYLTSRAKFIAAAITLWAVIAGTSSCSTVTETMGEPAPMDSTKVVNVTPQ